MLHCLSCHPVTLTSRCTALYTHNCNGLSYPQAFFFAAILTKHRIKLNSVQLYKCEKPGIGNRRIATHWHHRIQRSVYPILTSSRFFCVTKDCSAGARQPGQAKHTYLSSYRGKLPTRRGKARFMYVVTVETSRPQQERYIHFLSYRGNRSVRAGKAHSLT
jgi:hypothetical protein